MQKKFLNLPYTNKIYFNINYNLTCILKLVIIRNIIWNVYYILPKVTILVRYNRKH